MKSYVDDSFTYRAERIKMKRKRKMVKMKMKMKMQRRKRVKKILVTMIIIRFHSILYFHELILPFLDS